MHYVYILKSLSFPDQLYIGQTDHLSNRLATHNEGKSIHTAKYKPWKVIIYFAFEDSKRAIEFEQYLKTGAGSRVNASCRSSCLSSVILMEAEVF